MDPSILGIAVAGHTNNGGDLLGGTTVGWQRGCIALSHAWASGEGDEMMGRGWDRDEDADEDGDGMERGRGSRWDGDEDGMGWGWE